MFFDVSQASDQGVDVLDYGRHVRVDACSMLELVDVLLGAAKAFVKLFDALPIVVVEILR